jgi:hypothetical protein
MPIANHQMNILIHRLLADDLGNFEPTKVNKYKLL